MKFRSHFFVRTFLGVALFSALAVAPLVLAEAKKAKYSVKEVMKEIHKGQDNIGKRAVAGTASKEEIAKLAEYYESLPLNEPPRGELASWKEKTAALVKASRALKAGAPGAAEAYKNATNCKACHSAHKPEEKK
jgi:cytochrome c553